MRQSFNDFSDLSSEPQQQFSRGLESGMRQSETYDMKEIEREGEIFGEQFGKEFASYDQLLSRIQELPAHNFTHKIMESAVEMRETMKSVRFNQVQEIKNFRKELAQKFKVLLAMLGVRDYQLSDKQASIEQLDF